MNVEYFFMSLLNVVLFVLFDLFGGYRLQIRKYSAIDQTLFDKTILSIIVGIFVGALDVCKVCLYVLNCLL